MKRNTSVHTSNRTLFWLGSNNINTLEWPAESWDPNIIENLWGLLVFMIYAHGRQHQKVDDLDGGGDP